jgi:hypothetical protein
MKQLLMLLMAALAHGISMAQIDSLYIHLDTTQLSTNFFWDEQVDANLPNGVDDFYPISSSRSSQLFKLLKRFEVHPENNLIPQLTALRQNNRLLKQAQGIIPITIADVRYNKIDTNAVIAGQLFMLGDQLFQTEQTSAFVESKLLVTHLDLKHYAAGTHTFRLTPDRYLHNYATIPTLIQMDFGDGLGFREVTFNQNIQVTYTSNMSDIEIKTQVFRGDEVHLGALILKSNNCMSTYDQPDATSPFPNNGTLEFPWLINTQFDGTEICGNVYPLVTGAFDKPLIFVEGIDFNQDRLPDCNGDFGWCQLTSGIDAPGYDYSMLARMPQFLDGVRAHGYDILLVDFCDGATYMEHNGQLLVHIIQLVNQHKSGNEPLVLAGASMGGQIVRYALDYMEQNQMPHCARLYLSLDSPHEGANIPVSIQQAIHLLVDESSDAETFVADYFNRPATKQLLNTRYIPNVPMNQWYHPTANQAWYDQMHAWGLPKLCRNVAIANGNINGEGLAHDHPGLYGSMDPIMGYSCERLATSPGPEAQFFISNSAGDPYYTQQGVTSNYGTHVSTHIIITDMKATISRWQNLFTGIVGIAFDPEKTHYIGKVPNDAVSWDYAPGGTRNTIVDLVNAINASGQLSGGGCNNISDYLVKHCFISTSSALGVSTTYPLLNIQDYFENNPLSQTFDLIHAPQNINEEHTYLSEENVAVLLEEMLLGESADGSALLPASFGGGQLFNYGKSGFNFFRNTHVTEGATVGINAEYELHYNSNNFGYPAAHSHFKAFTLADCAASHVLVDHEGTLELGSTNLNTSAELKLLPESSLTIGSAGHLRLHPGSSILIENNAEMILFTDAEIRIDGGLIHIKKGGKLIIRSNGNGDTEALIELLQADSRILLDGGEIVVENGLTFKVNHNGQVGGYVEVTGHDAHNVALQNNATFALIGNGKDDLILKIQHNADLWTTAGTTGTLLLDKGWVDMSHSGSIWTKHRFKASNLKIEDVFYQDGLEPASIYITNQTVCTLYNCDFDRVYFYTWRTHSSIHTCSFKGITDGIKITEGSYNIQNSLFDGTNIRSNSLSHLSLIQGSHFINQNHAHALSDESLVEIRMSQSSIQNSEFGLYKLGGKLSLKCNDFRHITGSALEISNGSINASTTSAGGYNQFENVGTCISLDLASSIDLFKGYNNLSGYHDYCIQGTMSGKHLCVDCQSWHDASYNYWGAASPFGSGFQTATGLYTPDMSEVMISVYYVQQNSLCHINTPNGAGMGCELKFMDSSPTLPVACGSGKPVVRKQKNMTTQQDPSLRQQNEMHPSALRDEVYDPGNPLLSTTHFNGITLDSALVYAASQMEMFDSLGSDAYANELFHEILTSGLDRNNSDIRWRMTWGRYHMKGCIENMFVQNELQKANNTTSFEQPVQYYVDVLNTMTDTLLTDSTYKEQFYLELDKGQLLRTIGQSLMAREAFIHLDDCQLDAPEQLALNNWLLEVDQEISLGQQYLDQGASPNQILLVIDTSQYELPMPYASSNYYFGMWIESPNSHTFMTCGSDLEFRSFASNDSQNKWLLFPNPNHGVMHVRSDSDLPADIDIYDTNGSLVWTQKVQFNGINQETLLEAKELVPGVYQLLIRQGHTKQFMRFVKI